MSNRKEPPKMSERTSGIIVLVCGLLLFHNNIITPLTEARNHAVKIYISHAVVGITPFALVFGLVYTIWGEKATPIFGHPQRPSKWGWLLAIVMFGIGQLIDYEFTKNLQVLGYKV